MNTQENPTTPVTRYLDERGIPYHLFRHSNPIHSIEQAARERGQRPEQIVRSILFRISRGGFVMVLMAGEKQVSWHALRRHLGTSRISMATEDEVRQVTGYSLGAVSPFGVAQPIRTLADQSALQEEEISIGSGVRYTTVILKRMDFIKALGEVEVGDFAAKEITRSE
jgi:Cys-tRNA(Pro)/Cys-tRNA(Cys) deacylase